MPRNHRLRVYLLALLCIVVLVGRVGGAHVHLCLDGNEPPSGLHLFDLGQHHGGADSGQPHNDVDSSQPHNDVDVVLLGDLIAKSKGQWQLSLALLAALVLALEWLHLSQRLPARRRARSFLPPPPLFLRPPLCGPPR